MNLITNTRIVENLVGIVARSIGYTPTGKEIKVYAITLGIVLVPDIEMALRIDEKIPIMFSFLQCTPMNKKFSMNIEKQTDINVAVICGRIYFASPFPQ